MIPTPTMTTRDEQILAHIGLYRLTFRRVLSVLFFEGRTPGNVLRRLLDEGRVQARGGLPDRLRYYQLTPTEARRRGLPIARSRPLKPQAFQTHLGVLWFCCMIHPQQGTPRRRLDREELRKLFGPGFPKGPHCLEGGERPCVWRVHATGTHTDDAALVKLLTRRTEALLKHETLGAWIRTRRYAVALLADTEGRWRRLLEVTTHHGLDRRTKVVVEYGPGHASAPAALRAAERGPGAAGRPALGAG